MESDTIENVLALIEKRPTDAELFQRLGSLYRAADKMDEARQAFERSLELDPHDAFTHLFLGNWYYLKRNYQEALASFERAAEFMPDEAIVYSAQGNAYEDLGKYDLADKFYKRAINIDPNDESARRNAKEWREKKLGIADGTPAIIRRACDNYQAATTVLLASRWLKAHPDDLSIAAKYAEMLYQMTRYDEALQVYMDAIEQSKGEEWCFYVAVGQLYRYRGDFPEAETWYQKGIDKAPHQATGYILLGAVQARQGKLKDAEESHRRATRCTEGCIHEAHHNLGLVLRGQGRLDDAAACFRKAIELRPDYADAIEALQDVQSALILGDPENMTSPENVTGPNVQLQ